MLREMLLTPVLSKLSECFTQINCNIPNSLEVNILRHPSASRPDGPDPPFFNIEAFKMKH